MRFTRSRTAGGRKGRPCERLALVLFLVAGCTSANGLAGGDANVRVDATRGRVSVGLAEADLRDLVPRLHAGGRWIGPDDYPLHEASSHAEADGTVATTLMLSGAASAPDLELTTQPSDDGAGILARLTARNVLGETVTIEGFELGVREGDGGSVRVGVDPDAASSTMWIQGQNSWSFVGAVKVAPGPTGADTQGRLVPDQELFRIGNNNLTDVSGIDLLLRGRDGIPLSWWNLVIEAPAHRGALLVGAVSAERFKTSVLAGFDPNVAATLPADTAGSFTALRIVSGFTGDQLALEPGAALASEQLVLAAYPTGLEALAAHTRLASARMEVLPRASTRPLRLGWSTWSGFFADIAESSLIEQARFVAEHLAPLGYQVVQLDDGYETGWGDWRMNDKFPSDYAGVASRIRDLGLVPGIWIAPFLADETLPVVAEHPDWFLSGSDGAPVIFDSAFFGFRRQVIDVTNPGAADFVRGNLARIRDAGIGLVKADFLFGASYEGRHHDPTITGLAAYRQGLRLIRDTLGPDVTIIAIAGPWLATAGAADYYRQSNDVVTQPPGPAWPFFQSEALGSAARSHAHDVFFRSDPDHVIVEPRLSLDEARAAATYVALSGGLWFSGDVLTELPPERLAILTNPDLLAIVNEGRAAVPVDLFEAAARKGYVAPLEPYLARLLHVEGLSEIEAPSVWKLDRPDGSIAIAIFNWSDGAVSRIFDRAALGLGGGAYRARDLWLGTESELGARLPVDQPRHSVTFLALRPS